MLDNGNILLFANGAYSADLHHSQVWELDPNDKDVVWHYKARDNPHISAVASDWRPAIR